MTKPRSSLRSETLKSALRNFIVPHISQKYFVTAIRTTWDVEDADLMVAQMNIWEKRREVDKIVSSFNSVVMFFSCLTAMESKKIRESLLSENQYPIETDWNSFEDNSNIIPGEILLERSLNSLAKS